jgi:hypothetical protein
MDNTIPPGMLSDKPFYSAHFMDLSLWEPSVRLVCRRHGLGCEQIIPGLAGTYPTFIVECDHRDGHLSSRSVVVKFFGPLFDGVNSYVVERTIGQWLRQQSLTVRSPAILAEGQLNDD